MSPTDKARPEADWVQVARVPLLCIWQPGPDGIFDALRTPEGELYLHTHLTLWLEQVDGALVEVPFVADTGASISIIGTEEAERSFKLPVPPPDQIVSTVYATASGAQTLSVRPERMRVRFANDLTAPVFDWPVSFQENRPRLRWSLLGLCGVIRRCRWVVDGTPSFGAPHGTLTIETRQQSPA